MYTFDEIVGIIRQRQDIQSPLLERMLDVKERYNGDYVIPLPSMENEPVLPPLTPALIAENIDAVAQRASSVMPFIGCPAIDQSKNEVFVPVSMLIFVDAHLPLLGIHQSIN